MALTTSEIQHSARDLMGHLNLPNGYQPGSFRAKLFDLWFAADSSNKAKLDFVFAAECYALRTYYEKGPSALMDVADGKEIEYLV